MASSLKVKHTSNSLISWFHSQNNLSLTKLRLILQSTFYLEPTQKTVEKCWKIRRQWYLISIKHIQVQRNEKNRMQNTGSGSEPHARGAQFSHHDTAGQTQWWALTLQVTKKAWIHQRLPNAHHPLPSPQMLPSKSVTLTLPLDILAQFLFQDKERRWWSAEALVSPGHAGGPGQSGCVGCVMWHPDLKRTENPWVWKERGRVAGLESRASRWINGNKAKKSWVTPAKAHVRRVTVPESDGRGQGLARAQLG